MSDNRVCDCFSGLTQKHAAKQIAQQLQNQSRHGSELRLLQGLQLGRAKERAITENSSVTLNYRNNRSRKLQPIRNEYRREIGILCVS